MTTKDTQMPPLPESAYRFNVTVLYSGLQMHAYAQAYSAQLKAELEAARAALLEADIGLALIRAALRTELASSTHPAAQAEPDLRAILKDVVSVAIAQLYEQHTADTLAEFPLKDLEIIVENTEPLRPQHVEKIYRRGFDAIYNTTPPSPSIGVEVTDAERKAFMKTWFADEFAYSGFDARATAALTEFISNRLAATPTKPGAKEATP